MGKYEVTQAEYEAVRGTNPSHFKGSRRPVESVSWNDAAEFCRRLSRKARKTMGLPTKAEWEYACRAGTATGYNTGSTLSKSQAKFGSSDGTVNVGSYAPNAWGLCDVHGNVGEWCADWYGENSHGSWLASDPSAPPLGSLRVQCGGSWDLGAKFCRSAVHLWTQPDSEDDASGFRVVCVGVSP
jgi:formylglycine-generating enzyme required for sulfatase activity